MKNEKYVFFSLIIIIGLLSISFASANENIILDENTQSIEELSSNENLILNENDDNTFINNNENLILNENDDNTVIDTNEKTKLSDQNTYSFSKLNEIINSGNTVINLTDNYKYGNGDGAFKDGIKIERSITINGNGITIDGSDSAHIFDINADHVIINNIIFTNGKAVSTFSEGDCGGAIRWYGNYGTLSNSTFNNNTKAEYGGAVDWYGNNGAIINSIFNDNYADKNGGAIYWDGENGAIRNSTFNNNSARGYGGAIVWEGMNGITSYSAFINNNAAYGGVINCYAEYNNVSYCLFVNNTAENDGTVYYNDYDENTYSNFTNNILLNNGEGEIHFKIFEGCNADYNWFGNNASNYNQKPYDKSNTWLFLNGTANPNVIRISDISEIIFKLYSYNGNKIAGYDNSKLYPINLSLSSTKGTLSKDTARLSEAITFQTDSMENATVSAIVEDAQTYITIAIADGTSFWDLNKTINDNNDTEITLNKNYTYNPDTDFAFIHGIIINRTVTINGNNNTINGSDLARIFHITGDNVIINNIIFTNGNATGNSISDQSGGAILWNGAKGSLNNSTFNNNTAETEGGAIQWYGEDGTVSNSTFNSNTANRYGGAILWEAVNGAISNSTFNNNKANTDGGSIYWDGEDGTVNNSTFNNNKANTDGGAVYWNEVNGAISNSTFNNNTAKDYGGAVYWKRTNGTLNNSTFNNNKANTDGGSILWEGNNGTLNNSTFNSNTAEEYGGAVLWKGQNGVLSNSTFNKNNAEYAGAVYWNSTNGTLSNSIFNNNNAIMFGGAVYWNNANGVIRNSTFNNNTANNGGAIRWYGKNGTVSNSTFNDNTGAQGGAVHWNGRDGTVSNSTFNANGAINGGAILWNDANGTLNNSTFNNNRASNGGAICWNTQYGKVSSCLFVNNTARTIGSVYYNNQENNHCNFTNNILLNNSPEEIYYYAFESANADYNWFGNNASDYNQKPYNKSKIWLFINGTADPEQIPVLSTSNIIFKLYAYDEATGEIIEFNDQIYPITLSLSSINGNLSQNSAGLGEDVTYSSESYGLGSVTASIENAKSTITIENIPKDAELEVSIETNKINYGENATINLEFNPTATGTVNITVTGKKHEINITEVELKENILISELNADEYTITVSYSGDKKFHPEIKTANTTLTVNKANPTVNVQDATTEWNVPVSIPVSVEGIEGHPATGTVIVTVIWAEDDISKVFNLEDGIESVTFTIDETVGNCTVTVRYLGDENYNAANANATLTVTESTELNVEVTDNSPVEGEDLIITVTATDGRGTEIPITKVNLTIDGNEPIKIELDENGNANLGNLSEGPHTITISVNDGVHKEKTVTKEIVVNPPKIISTEIVVTVENISYGAKPVIEFTFKDISGNPLSGTLNVTVADKEYPVTVNDDGKGTLTIQDILPADTYPVVANFAGNQTHTEATGTAYFNIAKNATMIIFENMKTKAVDPKVDGRIGEWFYFTLKDANGNPIANAPMEIGFNGVVYTYEKDGICTDENGIAKLQINLGYKGDYTFAICYLGNQSYNASFVVAKITVNCQTPTLTVPNKSYAASAKTKTLTATFKNEHGKLIADKQISFTVNGKTYKAKTNSKGVASVNVSLNKKGTYTVVAKYAGASTYNAVSKKAKLTIK